MNYPTDKRLCVSCDVEELTIDDDNLCKTCMTTPEASKRRFCAYCNNEEVTIDDDNIHKNDLCKTCKSSPQLRVCVCGEWEDECICYTICQNCDEIKAECECGLTDYEEILGKKVVVLTEENEELKKKNEELTKENNKLYVVSFTHYKECERLKKENEELQGLADPEYYSTGNYLIGAMPAN